jgi:hypothetical protein
MMNPFSMRNHGVSNLDPQVFILPAPTRRTNTVTLGWLFAAAIALSVVSADGVAGEEPVAKPNQSPAPASPTRPAPASPRFNGRDLSGWRIPREHFFKSAGSVVWKEGQVVLAAGDPGTAIAWGGEVVRQNYELTLEAKRLAGDDFFCGLTFPIDKSYCTLILGGWGGFTTGLSNIDGFAAVENDTTGYVEFKNDQWYSIRLRVTPERIQVWVDRQELIDLDPRGKRFEIWWEQEPVRPLGIATWNTTAAIRNLKMEKLP